MEDSKKGVGLLALIGKPKNTGDEDDVGDTKRMAAKAMFKALKADDFDGFYEGLCEVLAADADTEAGDE